MISYISRHHILQGYWDRKIMYVPADHVFAAEWGCLKQQVGWLSTIGLYLFFIFGTWGEVVAFVSPSPFGGGIFFGVGTPVLLFSGLLYRLINI